MKSENKAPLTFLEAAGIIVGHGVGAGILAVPYLAAHNSMREIILILLLCVSFNIVLHLLIAELSVNNDGAQFVSCFERELFAGKLKKAMTWTAFILMGASVIVNVVAYLTGAAEVFHSWSGGAISLLWGKVLFYAVCAGIVFFGLKLVGICEKYAVGAMAAVVAVLFIMAVSGGGKANPSSGLRFRGLGNALALYGQVSFSLSAVMSTPQVVKGLGGNAKRIRGAIITGIVVNALLIFFVTLTTLIGCGSEITKRGALVDLAEALDGRISVIGYVFQLLALATSFWANTLNLRDIIGEQTKWPDNLSWLAASLPCLLLSLIGLSDFVSLSRFAGIIQVVTGLGIILAYAFSRKRVGRSEILGAFGSMGFRIAVAVCTLLATVGSLASVS